MSELVAQAASNVTQALGHVLGDPYVLAIIVAASAYGVFMGAVPGLTATMAVALVVPVTFFMDPIPALAAIVTLEACAIFAGDIPNALLRIPGTPSSAAYADDAYALTRAGRSAQALGTCLTFSVVGGLFGTLVLVLFAPGLAEITSLFTVAEYFWLYVLGLSCAVIVSRGSTLKGTLALIIGLLLSTVGLSAVHTQARFTFGRA
jgi:putative tricarboxylic transport membrane protein